MVLSRNDKRKRKEGDLVDLMGPLSELPKRAKVHAQRKFAQGAATVFSPTPTLVKEKEKPKPSMVAELITHKRPNTEDFLTFLCFRGTSILPPSLNFFNVGSKKEKSESKSTTKKSNSSSQLASGAISKCELNQNNTSKIKCTDGEKKKVGNSLQKNVSKYKTATSTVQALKKKYQEQRLAKQRIENKLKAPCVMRTRSTTGRTIVKTSKLTSRKFLPRIEPKRHCLRSNTIMEKSRKLIPQKNKTLKTKKKPPIQEESSEASTSSESSSESDTKLSPQSKKFSKMLKNNSTSSKSESRRVTRSHSEISTSQASQRPSRKTKEAAAVYMEILSRKLVSPDLEIDDNLSLDSYPELPNARRTTQTENEMKAKVKSGKSTKEKDKDVREASVSRKIADRTKSGLKNKKPKLQKYSDTEDESISSAESNITRPMTRRSGSQPVVNPSSRSLRSSARNFSRKTEQNTGKIGQDGKTWVKRKREQGSSTSPTSEKSTSAKEKKQKGKGEQKFEDESLGDVLNKIRKKRESMEAAAAAEKKKIVQKNVGKITELKEKASTPVKVSDDEGSFRGFATKTTSTDPTSSNDLNMDVTNSEKVSEQKIQEVVLPNKLSDSKSQKSDVHVPIFTATNLVKSEQRDSLTSSNVQVGSLSTRPSSSDSEVKCIHKSSENTEAIVEIPTAALGRKERVNMSTEQIEKWLNESSMAKEESKAEMETVSHFHFEVAEKNKTDIGHISIPTRIQHLVRPVNVAIAKMAEKVAQKDRLSGQIKPTTAVEIGIAKIPVINPIPTNRNKINAGMKEIIKARIAKAGLMCLPPKEPIVCEDSEISFKVDQAISTDGILDKKSPEKKAIFQPRKAFLPKVKERKTTTPSVNAFSPENESSVYAFESDTETPVSTPFRRKQRDSKSGASGSSDMDLSRGESDDGTVKTPVKISTVDGRLSKCKSVGISSEDVGELSKILSTTSASQFNKFEMPERFKNLSSVEVLPLDKVPQMWNNLNCSASIAVQVNFDDQPQNSEIQAISEAMGIQKSTEISTQTESTNEHEDDNDAHVFYIPLQTVARNGPNLIPGQSLIQGVAVKLGTEGPNGPNQRVLLRAQLVTKPPMAVARCPPVGTVQPTTRTPATITEPVPSTSGSSVPVLSATMKADKSTTKPQIVGSSSDKVPKSPKTTRERKTSMDAGKMTKKNQAKAKKILEASPINEMSFPSMEVQGEARLVEAPTFHPSEKDFQDPLEYIEKIRPIAEKYGICRVVPPSNFKPDCKVSDDMRFTAYNQYIHRMLHRWGPNVKEMMAIKKYLATQSITLNQPPWIGGMEVDLPHLYQTVQSLGGLKEVIEKKKWQKVADGMKIPKSAQDRVTKLDDIYCKYLLPYDTLSPEEREALFEAVEAEWQKREAKALEQLSSTLSSDNDEDEDEDSSDETDECIVKGRNMPLNAFYRIARNTQRMWFGESSNSANEAEGASATEVENAFWKHVAERKRHVCVHSASIDSSGRGFGFSVAKNSPFARHPWNLKVLTNNTGSVLRALGPLMGVTVPTLHVGMLFSACCWYRDPHGLPWIEYLHTGAKKIWYGIPNEHNDNFREALAKMVPRYCKNKTIWLPSDTAMVPPEMLVSNGVPLCRTVQEPGQFIIVCPKAFTSSICTGYVVSESVYFAQTTWLEHAEEIFKDLQDSCEPSMFSFERLLFSIINDSRSHVDVLRQILPVVTKIRERELNYRQELKYYGLEGKEKLPLPGNGKRKKSQKVKEDENEYECETCRMNLFISLVNNSQDDSAYCLPHALQLIARKKQVLKSCILKYTYSEDELDDLIHKLEDRIEAKSKKTNQTRQTK